MKGLFLIIIAFSFMSCKKLLLEENNKNLNIEDFETTWKTVKKVYPLLEYKKVNWDSIYTVYKPLAEKAKGDEIYSVLFDMLKVLKDGHCRIFTEGGFPIFVYQTNRFKKDKNAYSPMVVRKYFNCNLKVAGEGKLEYEYLTPDIGYIYLPTFEKDDWISDFDDALSYLSNSKGLIIDERNNGGGLISTVRNLSARFLKSEIYDTLFLKESFIIISTKPSSCQYRKPVVVLINGASASGGDIFPAYMKRAPNVTLIGDTTAGMANRVYDFPIPSGKYIRITDLYFKYKGKILENNGMAPDICVEQTEEDIKHGVDYQLEYAIKYLNGTKK